VAHCAPVDHFPFIALDAHAWHHASRGGQAAAPAVSLAGWPASPVSLLLAAEGWQELCQPYYLVLVGVFTGAMTAAGWQIEKFSSVAHAGMGWVVTAAVGSYRC
jgi:hypothetical protein